MKKVQSQIEASQIATPASAPDSSHTFVYPKSDGLWYYMNSDGVEHALGSGGTSKIQEVFRNNAATGQYIVRASNAAFNIGSPSKFTVRMWFYAITSQNASGLATRSSLASSQGDWSVGLYSGVAMQPVMRLNNNAVALTSTTILGVGVWYFLEFSYDSSLASNNMKIFINGVLDCQANYSTVISNNAVQLAVGTFFDNAHCMQGYISEFEFCAGVVRNTVGYTPPATITPDGNTTVLWRMNELALAVDSSGNGFTGTVSGTVAAGADNGLRFIS